MATTVVLECYEKELRCSSLFLTAVDKEAIDGTERRLWAQEGATLAVELCLYTGKINVDFLWCDSMHENAMTQMQFLRYLELQCPWPSA